MKKNKLLLLNIVISSQLLSMDNSNKAIAVSYSQQLTKHQKFKQVFNNTHLLKTILSSSDLNLEIIPRVSKFWNQQTKELIKHRYCWLMQQQIPQIIALLHLPENAMPRYKSFANFIDLYIKLARQAGKSTTKPKTDITNPELLLNMAQEAQTAQDENLTKIWPEISQALRETGSNPVVIDSQGQPILDRANNQQEITTAEQMRNWLYNQHNQEAIQQIRNLNLRRLELTVLPEEISVLTSMQKLNLEHNKLTELNVPTELTILRKLYLFGNQLTKINITSKSANLLYLNLGNNQLTKISIPVELASLHNLFLNDNQLTKFSAPPTLTDLRWLDLRNNQLVEINIPAELTALKMLILRNNQLTPESTTIPQSIRQLPEIYIDIIKESHRSKTCCTIS